MKKVHISKLQIRIIPSSQSLYHQYPKMKREACINEHQNAEPNFMVYPLNRKDKQKEDEKGFLPLLVQGLIGLVFFFDLAADHGAGHG